MSLLQKILCSTTFMLINLFVICYTFLRLIWALSLRNKLAAEITEYNNLVKQSRLSLNFISENVQKTVEGMEADLARELRITQDCTIFENELNSVKNHFAKLEERALEYLRMNPNMRSITIETPHDINEDYRKILTKLQPQPIINANSKVHHYEKFNSLNK